MYITNFNLNRIIKSVELEASDLLDNFELKKNLSRDELLLLSQTREFFKNNKLKVITFKPIEVEDKYRLLNEGSKPAYHINDSCDRLNSKYINYYVPSEVQDKGQEEVKRFRKYVQGLLNSEGVLEEASILAIKAEFLFSDNHFGKIERDNSGGVDFSIALRKLSLDELEVQLQENQKKISDFSKKSKEHKKVYNIRYKEPREIRNLMNSRSAEIRALVDELATLKEQLILVLIEKFKKETGFSQSDIEENLLEELGFMPCKTCIDTKQSLDLT